MRRSLGTAVFSGMLGVTLFGIFLTPVFFYVIEWLGETRLFAAPRLRSGSARRCWAALLGVAIGLLAGSGFGCGDLAVCGGLRRRGGCCAGAAGADRAGARHRRRKCRAASTAADEKTERRRDFPLLHRPADLRLGAVDRHHAGRRRGRVHAAGRAVSRGDAADGAGDGALSRGQRPDGARHRGRADRAAGQRRRGHDVHVVAMHQRRHLHA